MPINVTYFDILIP